MWVTPVWDRLTGQVVKTSASGAEDPRIEFRFRQDFPRSSHTSHFKIGTPVATLPGAWYYRVSAGTGQPSVSILWLGEIESLICNFSVWQHVKLLEQIRPWDTLACCWDVKQPTNKLTPVWAHQDMDISEHGHIRLITASASVGVLDCRSPCVWIQHTGWSRVCVLISRTYSWCTFNISSPPPPPPRPSPPAPFPSRPPPLPPSSQCCAVVVVYI